MVQKNPNIGLHQYEKKKHGSEKLPFAVYRSKIPEGFTYYPMHWHEEMEILFVEEGELTLMVNGQKFCAEKGEFYLISPGMMHAMEQISDKTAIYYNVIFHPRLLMSKENTEDTTDHDLASLVLGTKNFEIRHGMTGEDKELVLSAIRNLILHRETNQEMRMVYLIKSDLFRLFYGISKIMKDAQNPMVTAIQMERMKNLTKWLLDHVNEEITLKSAADFAGYSTSYFSKFFRNYTGTSFLHYFTMLKLEKSKKLLEATELTAMEVAEVCGFQNYSYFIRTFKRYYEITPKQYQMQSRFK